jgi:exodeoxyribonuclease V alpha subunit
MNSMAENVLFKMGVLSPGEKFYHGRPVMISRNDYSLSLFNGDIGITSNADSVEVVFPGNDGEPRVVHPSRLPEHETAFAMTIHKSQGSEFNNVLVVMPDKWNMVMTRELLYTAVTRARNGVVIAAGADIIREMIVTPTRRMSGLKKKLWGTI